jgi:hypothetical protein
MIFFPLHLFASLFPVHTRFFILREVLTRLPKLLRDQIPEVTPLAWHKTRRQLQTYPFGELKPKLGLYPIAQCHPFAYVRFNTKRQQRLTTKRK